MAGLSTDALDRAQAVRCGAHTLAWPHGLARAALERVELSAVPNAPAWLAGATNIDGRIVPILDLAAWLVPGSAVDPTGRNARLLVLGQGEETAAVLFEGLPRLVRIARQPATLDQGHPDLLRPFALGFAEDDPGIPVVDARALIDSLISQLNGA